MNTACILLGTPSKPRHRQTPNRHFSNRFCCPDRGEGRQRLGFPTVDGSGQGSSVRRALRSRGFRVTLAGQRRVWRRGRESGGGGRSSGRRLANNRAQVLQIGKCGGGEDTYLSTTADVNVASAASVFRGSNGVNQECQQRSECPLIGRRFCGS